ncbi:hypothetical protein BDW71DRAFT_197984 [Aspergillus fruticulosus]
MPSLEHLPKEIIDSIVSHLELNDIRNLRLTSRSLALGSSGSHFKSYFRRKHVDLTEHALRNFVEETKPGRTGRLLQDLVLIGGTENTPIGLEQAKAQLDLSVLMQRQILSERMRESGTYVRLLTEAFGNLIADGRSPGLQSLSLQVVVYRVDAEKRLPPDTGGSWTLIWRAAGDTFHTALGALAASRMPVERLDIYNCQQRCSLACTELSAIDFECKGLATSLATLRIISISYSDRIINVRKEDIGDTGDSADEIDHDAPAIDDFREDDDIEVEACDEANFLGLARLLKLCSGLENLELHHYAIPLDSYPYFDLHRDMFLQRIVATVQLPKLQRCTLRGLRVREVDLLEFLKKTTPAIKDFQMDMVRLASGTFSSIFDYCTSEHAGLERLYFNDLFAPGELEHAYYDRDPGKPRLINFDGPCSNMLDRIGPEVRRPIVLFMIAT